MLSVISYKEMIYCFNIRINKGTRIFKLLVFPTPLLLLVLMRKGT